MYRPKFHPSVIALCASLVLFTALTGCTGGSTGTGGKPAPSSTEGSAAEVVVPPAPIPEVLAPGGSDILAYVTLPNLDSAIDRLAQVADLFQAPTPGQSTAAKMKAQLGMSLGDPELRDVDTKRPIVVFACAPPQPGVEPVVLGLLSVREGEQISARMAAKQMPSKKIGNLLAIGQTPESLDRLSIGESLYARIADAGLESELRLYVDAEQALAHYRPRLMSGIDMLSSLMQFNMAMPPAGTQGVDTARLQESMAIAAAMLRAEVLTLVALLDQMKNLQLDFDLSSEAVDCSALATAKSGSDLEAYWTASGSCQAPANSLVESKGMMSTAWAADGKTLRTLAERIYDQVAKDRTCSKFVSPELRQLVSQMEVFSGPSTAVMDFGPAGFRGAGSYANVPEAKLVEIMSNYAVLFGPDTQVGKAYATMGMQINPTFERGARTSSGAAVHRFKTQMKMSEVAGLGAENQALIDKLSNQSFEFASVGDTSYFCMDPKTLDAIVSAAEQKKPGAPFTLAARTAFGPGRQAYMDFEMGSLVRMISEFTPTTSGSSQKDVEALASVSGSHPLMVAYTCRGSKGLVQTRFPLSIVHEFMRVMKR